MKIVKTTLLVGLLAFAQTLPAAEVVEETRDHTAGAVFGGAGGLMVGGAIAGGPAGALLGGLIGIVGGKFIQEETGLSQRSYRMKSDHVGLETVRSPNRTFDTGDSVEIVDKRLR